MAKEMPERVKQEVKATTVAPVVTPPPAPVAPEPVLPTEKPSRANASGKTAAQLLAYLEDPELSGTPPEKLKDAYAWLADAPAGTAEDLYRHMEAHHAETPGFLGTLRKAGKWTFGDGFEPVNALADVPQEEIVRLREENARLQRSLAEERALKLGMMRARDYAVERANELQRKLALVTSGRTPSDVAALGIES